jgi:hypothetical protein
MSADHHEATASMTIGTLGYRARCMEARCETGCKPLGEVVPAEQDFRDVIALAQKIMARAPELRATMSPARLLRDTGRTPDIMGTM